MSIALRLTCLPLLGYRSLSPTLGGSALPDTPEESYGRQFGQPSNGRKGIEIHADAIWVKPPFGFERTCDFAFMTSVAGARCVSLVAVARVFVVACVSLIAAVVGCSDSDIATDINLNARAVSNNPSAYSDDIPRSWLGGHSNWTP